MKLNKKTDLILPVNEGIEGKFRGIERIRGELWTSRQRQMHPLHYAISYRASFKPELPDFFIKKYLKKKDGLVLDPFGGRGTTVIQANLLGYSGIHNDLNPVSQFLCSSRQFIPPLVELQETLDAMDLSSKIHLSSEDEKRLSPFFHRQTLEEIVNLRKILKKSDNPAVHYIGLTALSRLHGHSAGFFSVYSFPQISIMPGAQRRNNLKRGLTPEYKGIKERIHKKMKRDLAQEIPEIYRSSSKKNTYLKHDARDLSEVKDESISLIVTSPPFLDKVNYLLDNWMRAWFLDKEKEISRLKLSILSDPADWKSFMRDTIIEMGRILEPGARAVIEVGEVVVGSSVLNLEELLIECLPVKVKGGRLKAERVYVNEQQFTKLANCWDVNNNEKGTNTNRCLVIRKTN